MVKPDDGLPVWIRRFQSLLEEVRLEKEAERTALRTKEARLNGIFYTHGIVAKVKVALNYGH